MDDEKLMRRFYPESSVGGFSHVDGTVAFFTQIASVLRATDLVLDFGAGRGQHIIDDDNDFRRDLTNLKGRCAHLEGCDVDDVVLENRFLDHAEVVEPAGALPYPDDYFDLIISRYVFEHIDDPGFVAQELMRVVKVGGLIAAVTPNRWGYIAIGASLLPNRSHIKLLHTIQPSRKARDVFPTRYRMNTNCALRKTFGPLAEVKVAYWSPEPAYHLGSRFVYGFTKWINKHAPSVFQPTLHIYVRKLGPLGHAPTMS